MPRYQFELKDGSGAAAAVRELADDQKAIREAAFAAGETLNDGLAVGREKMEATIIVKRDNLPIAEVRVSATVERLT